MKVFPRFKDASDRLVEVLRRYITHRLALWTADAFRQLSGVVSFIFTALILLLGIAFFLLFLAIALGVWIGEILHSYPLGFLITAGIWLIFVIVIFLLRNVLFTNHFIRRMYRTVMQRSKRAMRYVEQATPQDPFPYHTTTSLKTHALLLRENIKDDEQKIGDAVSDIGDAFHKDIMAQGILLVFRVLGTMLVGRRRKKKSKRHH